MNIITKYLNQRMEYIIEIQRKKLVLVRKSFKGIVIW